MASAPLSYWEFRERGAKARIDTARSLVQVVNFMLWRALTKKLNKT